MASNADASTKKASASTPTISPPKHKERPLGVKGLKDLDVKSLANPIGDEDFMESATHALGTADSSKSSLEVLNDLLQSHKQTKRSRATRQCFIQHVSSARNLLLQSISDSRDRGNHRLAYDLLERLHNLEQQCKGFLLMCDSVGFDRARDLYLNRGKPPGGQER